MELVIDLDAVFVRLVNPLEFTRFQVTIGSPEDATALTHGHRLGDVLVAQHLGVHRDDGDVSVDPQILRFLAAGQVDEDWEAGFSKMVDFAESSGWIDEEGRIQAHVVWPVP